MTRRQPATGRGQEAQVRSSGGAGADLGPGVRSTGTVAVPGAVRGSRAKYGNRRGEIDGMTFDSQAEGRRYLVLRDRLRTGEIVGLEVHPSYRLEVGGTLICHYVADFAYYEPEAMRFMVEDVKSEATRKLPVYRLKRKLMKALLGIDVVEV